MKESTLVPPDLPPHALTILEQFLTDRLETAGAEGYALGLSGGLDSAVVAALCARAVGPANVLTLSMPSREVDSTGLAAAWAQDLGVEHLCIPLDELHNSFGATLDPVLTGAERGQDKAEAGCRENILANVLARMRMVVLYAAAQSRGYLVAGTSNKSELMVGYFTKWGDGASDVAPLGDLYKSQVYQLARELEVPRAIQEAPPSAELVEGQTDEQELGMSYHKLDRILWGLERKLAPERLAREAGVLREEVDQIVNRLRSTAHKRKLSQIPKLGLRTVGLDWREVVGLRGP